MRKGLKDALPQRLVPSCGSLSGAQRPQSWVSKRCLAGLRDSYLAKDDGSIGFWGSIGRFNTTGATTSEMARWVRGVFPVDAFRNLAPATVS